MGKREKGEATLRLVEFVDYLREHPEQHKVAALAGHFGVDRNQIYRWAKYAYDRYGIPIDLPPLVERGCVKLGEGDHALKRVTLDRIEVEALLAAAVRIEALTPYARQALDKLEDARRLPEDTLQDPVLYSPLMDEYAPELFERVVKAVRDYRVAQVSYTNARGERKTYLFNSYALIADGQHLYLVGIAHSSLEAGYDTVIPLRLDQIEHFVLQQGSFKKPSFDAKTYALREFGPFKAEGEVLSIKVRFSAEKARYIERTRRHESQRCVKHADGTLLWSISAPLNDALVYWITSYGPHATVLEPEELREQVLEWAQGSVNANS